MLKLILDYSFEYYLLTVIILLDSVSVSSSSQTGNLTRLFLLTRTQVPLQTTRKDPIKPQRTTTSLWMFLVIGVPPTVWWRRPVTYEWVMRGHVLKSPCDTISCFEYYLLDSSRREKKGVILYTQYRLRQKWWVQSVYILDDLDPRIYSVLVGDLPSGMGVVDYGTPNHRLCLHPYSDDMNPRH